MSGHLSSYPFATPLPRILPLDPPSAVLRLLKQHQASTPLSQNIGSNVKNHIFQESQDYQRQYEQKCIELIDEIGRSKQKEEQIIYLKNVIQELKIQIEKMQSQRWDKVHYLRQERVQKRSKSFKKMTPTIDVCLEPQREQQSINRQHLQMSKKVEYLSFENSKLKEQLYQLRSRTHQPEGGNISHKYYSMNVAHAFTPFSQNCNQSQYKKGPHVSQFTPEVHANLNTIKKDEGYEQKVYYEIRRLKNQILYRDLLLNELRSESSKQSKLLKKHLELTVDESAKVAEQTSNIINKFKDEIIDLKQRLDQERRKAVHFEKQLAKYVPSFDPFKYNEEEEPQQRIVNHGTIVEVLKIRRDSKAS